MPDDAHYGHRARLGLIVPPNNTVTESEWADALPDGVSLHAMRFALNPLARGEAELEVLRAGLANACALLAEAELSALAFACTAPSAVSPRAAMETLMSTAGAGLPAATAAAAVVDALMALGARRVVLMSPFSSAVTPVQVRDAVLQLDHAGADAIVLSGTSLVTFPVLQEIETRASKPVVGSNQALLWSALRKVGIQDALALGRLFSL
jgi:maleate cis-trans isomerase